MKYLSVTEVLSPYQDFSKVSERRLEAAQIRGTGVHKVSLLYAGGFWPVVPDEYRGYFKSFMSWWITAVDVTRPVLVEPELKDPDLGIIGHPDLLLFLKGDPLRSTWDLKTPTAHYPTWKGQLAAYKHLGIKNKLINPGSRCGSVRLDANGRKPKPKDYEDDKRDFAAFLAALTAHRYFRG